MPHREHEQGYRGRYDRDYEADRFERERDDRWQRSRERDWDDRGYRAREDYGEDWQGGRYGPGMRTERREERPGLFSPVRSARSYSGAESPDWRRDEIERREMRSRQYGRPESWESDYGSRGGEDYGGYGAPWQSAGYGMSGFAFPRRFGDYDDYSYSGIDRFNRYESGAGNYGPSIGYGYGPTESYLRSEPPRRRSEPRQRNFAGRGPRGYRRSDERIREDINERLTLHPDLDATDIDVRVENCVVTLGGVVEDRKAKRLAEDIAEDVWGADDVRNELKVRHGFLAALTGEQADEREVTRPLIRETNEAARRSSANRPSNIGSTTPE